MSERAKKFLQKWVDNNVHATGYQAEGDNSEAEALAQQCLKAAKAEGIQKKELEEEADDDLVQYFADAIEAANDYEVQRLADKDD